MRCGFKLHVSVDISTVNDRVAMATSLGFFFDVQTGFILLCDCAEEWCSFYATFKATEAMFFM